MSGRPLGFLERAVWYYLLCTSVEDGFVLPNVVYLEREMIKDLRPREENSGIKCFFPYTLYHWTTAFDCFHFFSFHDFLYLFIYFFSFGLGVSLVYFMYTWVLPLAF
jgi:hypothetical protein